MVNMYLAIYGEKISVMDAMFISIFAMVIVFIVLLIISYMIDIVSFVLNKKNKDVSKVSKDLEDVNEIKFMSDDTVTVIASVIAVYFGTDVSNIHIKKIRRIG